MIMDKVDNTHGLASSFAFRKGMRALAGTVAVVATHDHDGVAVGLTATAISSLSDKPPSLLVCLNEKSAIASAIHAGALFSVNLLSERQMDVAQAFGGQRPVKGIGRFAFGSWIRSPRGTPSLLDSAVSFECEAAQISLWATHLMVIGYVVDAFFPSHRMDPLVYHNGHYHKLGEQMTTHEGGRNV